MESSIKTVSPIICYNKMIINYLFFLSLQRSGRVVLKRKVQVSPGGNGQRKKVKFASDGSEEEEEKEEWLPSANVS